MILFDHFTFISWAKRYCERAHGMSYVCSLSFKNTFLEYDKLCVLFTKIYSGVDHPRSPFEAFAISPCDIMQLCHVEYFKGQQIERRSKPGSNNKKYNVGTKCTRQISFWQIYLPALSLYLKKVHFWRETKKDHIWKYFLVEGQRGKTGCLKFEMVPDVISDRSQLNWPMPLENT